MATTTNYSWTTPDDTDLVKDGASAIRTLGSSADTTVKNLNPGTTAGDIDYYTSSTAKARIAIGTAGQVLAVNAGATAPEWKTIAAAGKVLQVVSATTTTGASNSTTTLADTNLTATITPSSASSTILVIVSQNGCAKTANNSGNGIILRLLRGATNLGDFATGGMFNAVGQRLDSMSYGATILDTPATTSATTYKTQFRNRVADAAVSVQDGSDLSAITLLEIGA